MLTVFGALKIEISHILRLINIRNIYKKEGLVIYHGSCRDHPINIIQTGMGPENAKSAARYFRDSYLKNEDEHNCDAHMALMIGLCGAADKDIRVGDIVKYQSLKSVKYDPGKGFINDGTIELSKKVIYPGLGKIIMSVNGASSPLVVADPAGKKELNDRFGIQAVDTESYWIGSAVHDMGLPFFCIRVVSDDALGILPSYFESSPGPVTVFKILCSSFRSIFSREESRMNIDALKNLKKANLSLEYISRTIISDIGKDH